MGAMVQWPCGLCIVRACTFTFCILYSVPERFANAFNILQCLGMCGTAGVSAGVYVASCNANPLWHSRDETAGLHFFGAGM